MSLDFIEQMQADINKAVENAQVFTDTKVVEFKPVFTETITPDSLREHIDFVNRNAAIVEAGVSQVALDQYASTKATTWEGTMDLGAVSITSRSILQEIVGDKPQFGITHTLVDNIHSEELTGWHNHFNKINHERCKNLFASSTESADEN